MMDNKDDFKFSISEEHGIDLIEDCDLNILSIGISTAGSAEIKMATKNPNSHIIATTIDKEGIEFSKKVIKEYCLEDRIEIKLEDVSEKMSYSNEYFDYVYARLVLHYLDNIKLNNAIKEIKRVIKKNGKFYIVVRSDKEWETKLEGTEYDLDTGLTKYPRYNTLGTDNVQYLYRRFFSISSLKELLEKEGFKIEYIKEYEEQLYKDYQRKEVVERPNIIIECLCRK